MGKCYVHLSLVERVKIEVLRKAGQSIREIARQLGRAACTVSRELKRNAKPTKQWNGVYGGERAHQLSLRRRRWDCRFKLARQPELRTLVHDRLAMGWSPQMIAGWLALHHAHMQVSHESIYRFIYHRSAQKDYWHRLLSRAKHRRGKLKRRGIRQVEHIKQRVSIHERPQSAASRTDPGHWEADLMLFARYGQAVLVLHERSLSLHNHHAPAFQSCPACCRSSVRLPCQTARPSAPEYYLRQRHRVCPALRTQTSAGMWHLLL